MKTRKEIAAEKKRCGSHNCTQAVLCTYQMCIRDSLYTLGIVLMTVFYRLCLW